MLGRIPPGTKIAGYEIIESLGGGGMGDVYLARREGVGGGKGVALKLLSTGLANDTRFRNRFEKESKIATSLEHPHIVPVYATGEVEGVRYIAMRFVDGPTLANLIERESPLDPRRVVAILSQVASALDDAHEVGLVHRDVKPGNVLISRGGASEFREHAYLTDFGISKFAGSDSGFTRPGQFVGTSMYAAPEQIQGDKIDGRTDVYAFGCVLFECLTGRVPFEKDGEPALMWAHMFEKVEPVTSLRPELPKEVDDVVTRAMMKGASERFTTCAEVVSALRAALRASTAERTVPPLPTPETSIKTVRAPPTNPPAGETIVRPPVEKIEEPAADEPRAREIDVFDERSARPGKETVIAGGAIAGSIVEPEIEMPTEPEFPTEPESELIGPEPDIEIEPPIKPDPSETQEIEPPADEASQNGETALSSDPVGSSGDGELVASEEPILPDQTVSPDNGGRRRVAVGAGVLLLLVAIAGGFLLFGRGGSGGQVDPFPPSPVSLTVPTVSGTARVGETLRVTPGRWENDPTDFSYQWRSCKSGVTTCRDIGTDTAVYKVTKADIGSRINVTVTAENAGGEDTNSSRATPAIAPVLSRPTLVSAPTVSGETQQGEILVANPGKWKGTTPIKHFYTWRRCSEGGDCKTIASARGPRYALTAADVDHRIRVEVRATNRAGRAKTATKPTGLVRGIPRPPDPDPPKPCVATNTCPPPCVATNTCDEDVLIP